MHPILHPIMSTINFYLKNPPDSKGLCQIRMIYQDRGARCVFYLDEKINPTHWDSEKQKVTKKNPAHSDINTYLERQKEKLKNIIREFKLKNLTPTSEQIRSAFQPKQKQPLLTFYQLFEKIVSDKSVESADASIKIYQTVKNHLTDFEFRNHIFLDYHKFNLDFMNEFKNFLILEKKLSDNTIHKIIRTLKHILSEMNKSTELKSAEIKIDESFNDVKLKARKADKVYLKITEYKKLLNYYPPSEKLQNVKNIFMFQIYTGLRYSDVSSLDWSEIKTITIENAKHFFIEKNTIKTESIVQIPLVGQAKEILDSYRGQFKTCFPEYSPQRFNEYLKEVCKNAGIDDEVKRVRFSGKERIEEVFPKYQLIASHTGRHTLATIGDQLGMPLKVIQSVLGHSNIKMTMAYSHHDFEINTKAMNNAFEKLGKS